ncbi:MAG: ABC transporter ATP-binding protein [Coxiellaceae bacterium]|nr:MAG: ABC transporter ATP-binding protein [Coxiellaceae bacterium]
MGDYAIDVRGLCKNFAGKPAVKDLNLQVKRGEIFGFLGPNGSGKTTTIRMLCGLLVPDAGQGHVLGYDIVKQTAEVKLRLSYMTQQFSLYTDLTVRENLNFMARVYQIKEREQRVDECIAELALEPYANQLAGTLSGGWKQRLALASSLLHKPQLLLLDEPTAGVDPKARRDFWDKIHQLASRGITVLVTTHYLDEAGRCNRLAYISSGKLLAVGTADDLIKLAGLTTWLVTGSHLVALADKLKQLPAVEQVITYGNTLHVSGKDAAALEMAIAPYRSMQQYTWLPIASDIEDVFIYLLTGAKPHAD